LILAAGNTFTNGADASYPISMTEFNGKPLVQWIIEDLSMIPNNKIVIMVNQEEINRFHVDRILKFIEPSISVVGVQNEVGGAACSALLGLQFLNHEEEILIINGNEKLTENYITLLENIREKKAAAAIVSFDSIHPRYSYAKIDRNLHVIEVTEKEPISRNALVGFFWFSSRVIIEEAIRKMILKDASLNKVFYLAPAINEIILEGLNVAMIKVDNSKYHPMKTEWQLNEYAKKVDRSK
jgi:dTDP-glucose pyrophosphorylase